MRQHNHVSGASSSPYTGPRAMSERRAPRAGTGQPQDSVESEDSGILPLSLRMPSMLCLAFLSPSSTSFLSSSASSSSPFPNLLRRIRLMELTSRGEAHSCDWTCPQQPPAAAEPDQGARSHISATVLCPFLAVPLQGFNGGNHPLPFPQRFSQGSVLHHAPELVQWPQKEFCS